MNFEFSLLDEEEKIIQFKTGEDNNNQETEINEIKTAIKKMFLTNQTNKKSLNDYSQLVTKIRNEYNILLKENEALKSQLEQYKNYYDANIVRQKNLTSVIENENPTIDIVIIMMKMMMMMKMMN